MRNRISLIVFVVLIATLSVAWSTGPVEQEGDLNGAWVFTSEDDSHQRGLFVITWAGGRTMRGPPR